MIAEPARVLVVDDEPQILRALRAALRGNGYDVYTAADGNQALDQIARKHPDVVVLDLVMPGKDGFAVVREVRRWSRLPIIVLSARGTLGDKVAALDLGADDYITKPFSINELLARLRVALRHGTAVAQGDPIIQAGSITIDLTRRVVTRDAAIIHVTPIEWALLVELARNAGNVLTHEQLLRRGWGPNPEAGPHYLHVYINQLRRKLEADPAQPQHLVTELGVGYRFVIDA